MALAALVALPICTAAMAGAAGTASLNITPSSIPGNYAGTVTLDITGLASGQVVRVQTFIDVNGNGVIDTGDMLVQSFTVTDGQALSFSGHRDTLVPGDDDNMVDGNIRAVLHYPGAPFAGTTVAKYVCRVSAVSGSFTPVPKAFTVTQPGFSQKVKGTVKSGGSPVAGAFVFIFDKHSDGPNLISVTGSDGQFTLNADVGTYFVGALKDGLGFDFSTAPQVTVAAGQTVTQDVTLTATDRIISGRLTDDDSGVGLPGVEMEARFADNTFTLVFTDANGDFSLHVSTAATEWQIEANWQSLALLGYNAPANRTSVDISRGDVSEVSLKMRQITALIYGTLTNAQSQPVGPVSFEAWDNDDRYDNYGVADASGNYVVGVTDGTWQVGPSSRALAALGYVAPSASVTVSGNVAKRQDFVAQLPFYLSGQVTDDGGQPVGNICINAWPNQGGNGVDTTTDANGNFSLPVASGSWNLQLCSSDALQRGLIGPTLSFPNVTQDVPKIQYVAKRAPFQISGWVKDGDGNPVSGVRVYANANINGTDYWAQNGLTDANGNYALSVADGTWRVWPECNDLQSRGYLCPNQQVVSIPGQSQPVNFTVQLPAALEITTTSLPDGTQGAFYGVQLNASGGVGSYNWTLAPGSGPLPSNLNLSTGGYISGTATSSGTYNFTVRVSDNGGHTADQGLSLFIATPQPLQITTTSLPNGTQGQSYGFQLSATGGVPSYIWDLAPGSLSLPPWLNLSSGGSLSGTPTNSGTYNFTVRVTDAASHTAVQGLSLAITTPQPLQITTYFPSGQVGVAYSVPLQASGGQPPYTWSLTPGSAALPPGLNISGNSVSGTPTTYGNFSFFIRVTDSANTMVDGNFSIFISPAPLQWITASLPHGRVDSAYSTQLQATGGVPPYYWALAPGSLPLPPGLTFGTTATPGPTPAASTNGVISGTPTTEGTFSFIVRVMDSYGQSVDRPFSLLIKPPRQGPCEGDCGGDGQVTVDEILALVNIALGNAQVSACDAGDANDDNRITVDEILTAVNNALNGC